MENFTTDELRYIRGMAGNRFHEELRKHNHEKADVFNSICVKVQSEIIKRNRK